MTGDVEFQISTSLKRGEYEYTMWLGRCGVLT
jgi:hypothetical protein